MHAIQIAQTGGPEVLRYVELPDPVPQQGEVLVDTEAIGLNYIDTYHRRGLYPMEVPFVPGVEGAGVVSTLGPGADGWAQGDRVAWFHRPGSYATKVLVPADRLVRVPAEVSLELAAALPVQGVTAHYLVTSTYAVASGDRVLIHAGAGGVGLLAIQLAALRGAEVFTTVSTAEKAALATGAGAHHVIRYDEEDFAEAVERLAGEPRPLAVVYDGVGADTFDRGLQLLRPRGMMVLFGQSSGPVPPIDLQRLAQNGSLFVTRPTIGHYLSARAEMEWRFGELFDLLAERALDVRIGERYPLASAEQAHRDLEARRTTGKVLLVP